MKYNRLILNVSKLESNPDLKRTDPLYFESIEKLTDVAIDLTRFDTQTHLIGVIKPFLVKWGTMARVVNRDGLDWEGFGKTINQLEPEFAKVRDKKFLQMTLAKHDSAEPIFKIYRALKEFPQLGGATNISKVTHLLNPEIFVMWDGYIRSYYHKRNKLVNEFPEGYIEFLKELQKELKEAFADRQSKTGKNYDAIELELRAEFKNKTLARIVDEYNYQICTLSP